MNDFQPAGPFGEPLDPYTDDELEALGDREPVRSVYALPVFRWAWQGDADHIERN